MELEAAEKKVEEQEESAKVSQVSGGDSGVQLKTVERLWFDSTDGQTDIQEGEFFMRITPVIDTRTVDYCSNKYMSQAMCYAMCWYVTNEYL